MRSAQNAFVKTTHRRWDGAAAKKDDDWDDDDINHIADTTSRNSLNYNVDLQDPGPDPDPPTRRGVSIIKGGNAASKRALFENRKVAEHKVRGASIGGDVSGGIGKFGARKGTEDLDFSTGNRFAMPGARGPSSGPPPKDPRQFAGPPPSPFVAPPPLKDPRQFNGPLSSPFVAPPPPKDPREFNGGSGPLRTSGLLSTSETGFLRTSPPLGTSSSRMSNGPGKTPDPMRPFPEVEKSSSSSPRSSKVVFPSEETSPRKSSVERRTSKLIASLLGNVEESPVPRLRQMGGAGPLVVREDDGNTSSNRISTKPHVMNTARGNSTSSAPAGLADGGDVLSSSFGGPARASSGRWSINSDEEDVATHEQDVRQRTSRGRGPSMLNNRNKKADFVPGPQDQLHQEDFKRSSSGRGGDDKSRATTTTPSIARASSFRESLRDPGSRLLSITSDLIDEKIFRREGLFLARFLRRLFGIRNDDEEGSRFSRTSSSINMRRSSFYLVSRRLSSTHSALWQRFNTSWMGGRSSSITRADDNDYDHYEVEEKEEEEEEQQRRTTNMTSSMEDATTFDDPLLDLDEELTLQEELIAFLFKLLLLPAFLLAELIEAPFKFVFEHRLMLFLMLLTYAAVGQQELDRLGRQAINFTGELMIHPLFFAPGAGENREVLGGAPSSTSKDADIEESLRDYRPGSVYSGRRMILEGEDEQNNLLHREQHYDYDNFGEQRKSTTRTSAFSTNAPGVPSSSFTGAFGMFGSTTSYFDNASFDSDFFTWLYDDGEFLYFPDNLPPWLQFLADAGRIVLRREEAIYTKYSSTTYGRSDGR
ncbi:unnamed protein product [Amoebophrya sp. A25]|nr:unnamed protein product [Amoebophrya sp. A25]|eukprot:GSA25T00003854001.1